MENSRDKSSKIDSSSERPSMAVVEATSRSTYRGNMDAKCNEYARTSIASYISVRRMGTGGSAEAKVIAGSAKPFSKQRVQD